MDVKSTLLLLVVMVIFAKLPRSFCLRFTQTPTSPLKVFIDKNKTNVVLRWDWDVEGGVLNNLKIKRYKKGSVLLTETTLASYYASGGSQQPDVTKYTLEVQNSANGYAKFVIKDITNQGNNQDGTTVDVMAANAVYVYAIEIDVPLANPTEYVSKIDLNTFRTPHIETYPNNQTASGGTVTFRCEADGKPTPTITWEKIGSSQSYTQGSTLTIPNFDANKVGVYKCTAKSEGITENATATGFVQFSTCGSGCSKEELGIEMTDLTFTNEYENPSTKTYRELKNNIETEILTLYAKSGKSISKCEVVRFRQGSVVAVVELAWPTGLVGPKDPLLSAINNGNFAGHTVTRQFVSPTSSPTQEPPTQPSTASSTPSNGGPDSGARTNDEGGLSTGAIIALVVVFSIIFIVIIVVLIVCMLKRKKPSDSGKGYKEDGKAYDKPTTPLKTQPVFDPMYDDPNENRKEVVYADLTFQDRYPNGGGPPPQYTPSNYAEVRPGQQDESQVEWDKSVKDEMWI